MDSRAEALAAFYEGPVWERHREEANATMVSSDDVLLLRPPEPGAAFADTTAAPPPLCQRERGFVEATILHLNASAEETKALLPYFRNLIAPAVADMGA